MNGGDVGDQAAAVIRHRRPDDAHRLAALHLFCLGVKPSFPAISDQIGIQVLIVNSMCPLICKWFSYW